MLSFFIANLIFAFCILAVTSIIVVTGTPKGQDLWKRLPRHRYAGIVIAVICLVWSAWYVLPMLEGGLARYQPVIKLTVPLIAVLTYLYLNYLFARALGGLLVLTVTWLLSAAFAVNLPARPLYALACYLLAVIGMIMIAAPWHFRDLLEATSRHRSWRWGIAGASAVTALFFLAFGMLGK